MAQLPESLAAQLQHPAQQTAVMLVGGAVMLYLARALAVRATTSRRDERPKMVLITGAGSGLGRAMALELLQRGDQVVGSDVDVRGLDELSSRFPSSFVQLPFNVSDSTSVREAAERLARFAGDRPCLDCIVNNAGVYRGGPVVELPDSAMACALGVNLMGPFLVTKYFYRFLRHDSEHGYHARIINLGSEVSYCQVAAGFTSPYAVTKFGVEAFSAALRQELQLLGSKSVYVSVINPGAHDTQMTAADASPFGELVENSLFKKQLSAAKNQAVGYMQKKRPASDVGKAVVELVHAVHPPRRKLVNVSMEMLFAKYTPQFVLDFAVWWLFG